TATTEIYTLSLHDALPISSFSTYGLNAQYNGEPAAILGQYQNSMVSWERAKDANLGFELGLMNRFNVTLDLYNKNVDGLLYYVQFPSTAGWSGYWMNIGGRSEEHTSELQSRE